MRLGLVRITKPEMSHIFSKTFFSLFSNPSLTVQSFLKLRVFGRQMIILKIMFTFTSFFQYSYQNILCIVLQDSQGTYVGMLDV